MAEIYTSIIAVGSESELTAMLYVLRKYSHDRKEQYQATQDCLYFDTKEYDDLTQKRIGQLINNGAIRCMMSGP